MNTSKFVLVPVVLILFCLQPLTARTKADSLFVKANEYYKHKDYFEAIDTYKQITDLGFKSAELYFNLANAYYKTGDYPRAILNYERATLLNPADKDIEFNLAKARTFITDKIEVIPDFFIKEWFRKLLVVLDSNLWATVSLALFFLCLVCLSFYLLRAGNQFKKPLFVLSILALVFAVLTFVFSAKTMKYIENSRAAIIMESVVRIKSSPDFESTDMFVIHEGTKVYILREIDNWSEIRLDDGKQGWTESQSIEKI